jgi:hypothetical protein
MSALLFHLVFLGCGEDPPTDPVEESDTDTDTDADTDIDTGAGWATLTGTITDSSGQALTNVRVQACVEGNCRYDEPDEHGFYEFVDTLEPDPASHAFDVVVKDPGYSTPLVPIWFDHGEVREIHVVVPAKGADVAIPETGAVDLEVVEGVHLSLAQDDLDLPFGVDGTVASGVRPDPGIWLPIEGIEGEVLAIWYLAPLDTASLSGGFDWWLEASTLEASDGETFQAWVVDYEHAGWASAGTLTVQGDKLVPDAQMPIISTLVVVK